jgi:hypothetical protein
MKQISKNFTNAPRHLNAFKTNDRRIKKCSNRSLKNPIKSQITVSLNSLTPLMLLLTISNYSLSLWIGFIRIAILSLNYPNSLMHLRYHLKPFSNAETHGIKAIYSELQDKSISPILISLKTKYSLNYTKLLVITALRFLPSKQIMK